MSEEKLQPDTNECTECEIWQESRDKGTAIRVEGSVDVSNSNVYFYTVSSGSRVIFQSTISNWQHDFDTHRQEINDIFGRKK
ncbi:hypothetical protein D3C71_1599360 [compost metagenome]